MKEVTSRWLKVWKTIWLAILYIIVGIPTLGFAWVYVDKKDDFWGKEGECWQLTAVRALEPWVHFWRGVLLSIAGLPTLGYTWVLMAHLEEPLFTGLRKKYSRQLHGKS